MIDAGDGVRLRGRIDRVERDAAGRLVVIDVKTAKTPAGKDDAQQHAQLAVYQLAVEAGLIGQTSSPAEPGWSIRPNPGRREPPSASRTR